MAIKITARLDIRIFQLYLAVVFIGVINVAAQNNNFYFTQQPVGYDVKDGETATLTCIVNNPADIVFRWTHDGITFGNSSRRYMDGSSLTFTKVSKDYDTGVFVCVARNVLTGTEITSQGAELNILWISYNGKVQLKEPTDVNLLSAGIDVTLRCRIEGNLDPTVYWYKSSTPLESSNHLDIRSNKITIKNVTTQDNGIYSCRAENRAGSAWSVMSNFTLDVINPNAPVVLVSPKDLIVNKNENALLHCEVSGDPPPEVHWYYNNEGPITNRSRLFIFPNGTLHITQVRSRYEGEYVCNGINVYGQDFDSASLHMARLDYLPYLGTEVVLSRSSVEVECAYPGTFAGGYPPPTFTWLDPSMTPVPSSGNVRFVGDSLIIDSVEQIDAGNYTCRASNMAGNVTTQTSIIVATTPRFTLQPENTSVKETGTAFLHCQAESTPQPTITWKRDGIDVMNMFQGNRYEVFSNGTLQIRYVQLTADDGELMCNASTVAGFVTATAYLMVQETLKFSSKPVPKPLKLGEIDTLVCKARGKTVPIVWWQKQGSPAGVWPDHINETDGTLTFSRVQKTDAGKYTCYAQNTQGLINETVDIQVVVYPEFTLEPVDTEAYEGYSAMMHCQADGDPTPQISWTAGEKKSLPVHFEVLENGTLYTSEVRVADEGKYTCIAGSNAGLNSREVTLSVINRPPTHVGPEERSNPLMMKTVGIAVGCAVAYIVLVVGLMVYCKTRRKKQKRAALARERKENGEAPKEAYKDFTDIKGAPGEPKVENEVAMNMMYANKRRGSYDKLQFPRHDLQTITMLGRGEFGEVFLAKAIGIRDGERETVVVVKALMSKDEDLQVEFKREIDMLSKLQHDNVVRLLGICKEADPQYMILEYLEWGDLKQFLKATRGDNGKNAPPPLHLNHKISLINQVSLGMEHLSNHRFIHKDLATRNCLVSPNLEIKVSNLALTKDAYSREYYEYHQSLIPIRWMPPEAIFEMEYSTKSDVWAFGVFIWEVFSLGELPFANLADEDVLKGLVSGEISLERPSSCPEELEALMHRCWEDSPKDRPSFSDIAVTIGELHLDSEI
ncbi:PTK7-like protein isoform X1 [Saccoglossus kowalevskii]|uniref:PTK7-like protein isoform X1 n=1 Tax=Saccoglossus kowalevskii TaxID=10224 RepID=A0ABM0MAL9_SACKO|nr:PREDICTED: PTK7-like protein isoform X1 [Saccoglossus kowalevskii]